MGKIIRFRGNRHRQTQEVLPWYVMDQLDDAERTEVETHLADCEACRRELETERELAEQVVNLPLNATVLQIIVLVTVAVGVLVAYLLYQRQHVSSTAPEQVSVFTTAARKDLYGDAFNEAVLMRPGSYLTRWLVYFDNRDIDGLVNGTAAFIGGTSGRVRRLQTGFVRTYALAMLSGSAAVVIAMLAVRLA